ncbi:hypothetical protein MUN84_10670 [Hymenobacter sp. 5516J-16]|uniref:hypothetical protein n=1 Tax=Hymenobacter sp. 5516J-16 TaxID=2932253 RepID=UPI001FD1B21A|nr:hypothetical protein [Hymenobacter sp. 5516J-16]UOQ78938.1 hypothetical protein MUN84_10670 [Hymenobacter sp. 5516J-16]
MGLEQARELLPGAGKLLLHIDVALLGLARKAGGEGKQQGGQEMGKGSWTEHEG